MSDIISVVTGEADESDSSDDEVNSPDYRLVNDGACPLSTQEIPGGSGNTEEIPRPGLPPPPTRLVRAVSAQPGVVIEGEASETDSDDEGVSKSARSVSDPVKYVGLPPLKVDLETRLKAFDPQKKAHPSSNGQLDKVKEETKYDSLLHRKLRERNVSLRASLQGSVVSVLLTSAKELGETNQMLAKSQSVVQDVCHNLRVFTMDLKQMEQKLDMINCSINIPNIVIEPKVA